MCNLKANFIQFVNTFLGQLERQNGGEERGGGVHLGGVVVVGVSGAQLVESCPTRTEHHNHPCATGSIVTGLRSFALIGGTRTNQNPEQCARMDGSVLL